MNDLDTLGRRHARLQAQIDEIRAQLASAIRAEREQHGTPVQELMTRSGYRSLESVRRVLDPTRNDRRNQRRRKKGSAS